MPVVLIVDDDNAHRMMLSTLIGGWGYETAEANDGKVAIEMVKKQSYDLVLTDIRMAEVDGITALEEIRAYNPSIPVVVMTAWSTVDKAMQVLHAGAADYLTKPLDFDVLRFALNKFIIEEDKSFSKEEKANSIELGKSPAMKELAQMIELVAPSEATILITGESGTGKEVVARSVQEHSLRKDQPFITVNCAALPENLLESELFGHEKGAFTGADKTRDGRFLQADKGTLFLDEIGEMPFSLQAKLLRFLQEGEVQRLGSDKIIKTDVRIITATNRDLLEEVKKQNFREDLYYRLNVISLHIPPLRDRVEDIPFLAQLFLERYSALNKKKITGFTAQTMHALLSYPWKGNVRELENAIERAVILNPGDVLQVKTLPMAILQYIEKEEANKEQYPQNLVAKTAQNLEINNASLDDAEKLLIMKTLADTNDNKSEAARRLGITRATLHNKLKKYENT